MKNQYFEIADSVQKNDSQRSNDLVQNLLFENSLKVELWSPIASKNIFKTLSLARHFSSLQEEVYRQKNINFVKNAELDSFRAKLAVLSNEKRYLEYLKNPDHPKFELVIDLTNSDWRRIRPAAVDIRIITSDFCLTVGQLGAIQPTQPRGPGVVLGERDRLFFTIGALQPQVRENGSHFPEFEPGLSGHFSEQNF